MCSSMPAIGLRAAVFGDAALRHQTSSLQGLLYPCVAQHDLMFVPQLLMEVTDIQIFRSK